MASLIESLLVAIWLGAALKILHWYHVTLYFKIFPLTFIRDYGTLRDRSEEIRPYLLDRSKEWHLFVLDGLALLVGSIYILFRESFPFYLEVILGTIVLYSILIAWMTRFGLYIVKRRLDI